MHIFPKNIDLHRSDGLTIRWSDGRTSTYPIVYLRKHSPAADAKAQREALANNPLAVLPATQGASGPLRAESVEQVGHYALRVRFSDGHATGLYTWGYLRDIDPGLATDHDDVDKDRPGRHPDTESVR